MEDYDLDKMMLPPDKSKSGLDIIIGNKECSGINQEKRKQTDEVLKLNENPEWFFF